jgi:hypothetical protein
MKYSDLYWKIFNFSARRIVAIGFVLVGVVLAGYGVFGLLPGGTVQVNGVPSNDLVLRWAAVVLPLAVACFGVALYKAAPYVAKEE